MRARGGVGIVFWLTVIGDGLRSIVKEYTMTLQMRRFLCALIGTIIVTIGSILIFPQGIVPLLFRVFGVDVRSWFVALYLPHEYQIPACLVSIILGLAAWYAVWSMARAGGDEWRSWKSVGDSMRTKWQR